MNMHTANRLKSSALQCVLQAGLWCLTDSQVIIEQLVMMMSQQHM
jgi:hypothetical protein